MWTAQPAIVYWHPQTLGLIQLVYQIRRDLGPIAYFTMDAGPQVKILCPKDRARAIMAIISESGLAQSLLLTHPGPGAMLLEEKAS